MDFLLTPAQLAFKREVEQFLAEHVTPALVEEVEDFERDPAYGPLANAFFDMLAEKGWNVLSWPVEYGGLGRSKIEEFLLFEALGWWGLAQQTGGMAYIIMDFGTDEQKARFLPALRRREMSFAIGYTEPNAGSDLASLQTRAVRNGDEYIVNGHKIYTSEAHCATHIWLAVRTDPDAPKHRGISVLIVPVNAPGITVKPLYTNAGTRTNEVFFDNVRVPVANRIGEENVSWPKMAQSLATERLSGHPTGYYFRLLKQLVEVLQESPPDGRRRIDGEAVRHTLADLYVDLEALRLLNLKTAWLLDQGIVPTMESAMVKVWGSEFAFRLYHQGMQILGRYGQLRRGSPEARLRGRLEKLYRANPASRFAGGTNEIQRDIIARRGLGLPR